MKKPLFSIDGPRVRQVISISMPRTMVRFVSRKSGRTLHAESQNEAFLMERLELDPNVLRFREQPGRVKFAVSGKMRSYVPDIYAEQHDGNYVYEMKPEKKLPENEDLFAAAEVFFASHGYKYRVVTDIDVRAEPERSNRRLLLKYAGCAVPPRAFDAARSILVSSGGCPIGQLADAIQLHGGTLHTVYSLVARGYAAAPMERLLCSNSIATWR